MTAFDGTAGQMLEQELSRMHKCCLDQEKRASAPGTDTLAERCQVIRLENYKRARSWAKDLARSKDTLPRL